MCGITGYYSFKQNAHDAEASVNEAIARMAHRGPDGNGVFSDDRAVLGHVRLSILDVSDAAAQPFYSPDGDYVLVFNGEIFNFPELRSELENQGTKFISSGDTEVLLHLIMREGESCLKKLNGFFAFAVYRKSDASLFIARDRYGEKPLLYAEDENGIGFGSEMKTLLALPGLRELDRESLYNYHHLNYIPAPETIFRQVKKLEPGHFIKASSTGISIKRWYSMPSGKPGKEISTFEKASEKLVELMDSAVKRRMISDVPLGAFLSGGIDSSVVVALASRYTSRLHTFSIGYADEPLFDETRYAKLVAQKYNTDHTVFSLRNQDLFEHLHELLDKLDEPFADSSALAVYILSKETRKHVTVALSGDGADELFGGYRKHQAEWRMRKGGIAADTVKLLGPLWKAMPGSRNSKAGNLFRKLDKFSEGASMSLQERYWRWCGYADRSYLQGLFAFQADEAEIKRRIEAYTDSIGSTNSMNDMLRNDMQLVLPGDMLTKVDLMSMANSLEVRPPFLDVEVVDFAMGLPADYKVNGSGRKRIVQDAFRHLLPPELYNRPKQGFEVPLLKWFREELDSWIFGELLETGFVKKQGLFRPEALQQLRNQLHSTSPGDATARVWALIVFQWWWRKWMK
ncbi:MAG: asparagine synthase (glutamine-hydrolyzing) [Bacteroidetes bacterium]|nr:asparagine synthase (glutamine-hydrolyzing) [Bacteroidota bacterium]